MGNGLVGGDEVLRPVVGGEVEDDGTGQLGDAGGGGAVPGRGNGGDRVQPDPKAIAGGAECGDGGDVEEVGPLGPEGHLGRYNREAPSHFSGQCLRQPPEK